jgi:hypothetical protein
MPADTWRTVTQTSRLIRAEESRTRARLNRLVQEGKIERKRVRGNQGEVYQEPVVSNGTNGLALIGAHVPSWHLADVSECQLCAQKQIFGLW